VHARVMHVRVRHERKMYVRVMHVMVWEVWVTNVRARNIGDFFKAKASKGKALENSEYIDKACRCITYKG
jgi:hypothetical protein